MRDQKLDLTALILLGLALIAFGICWMFSSIDVPIKDTRQRDYQNYLVALQILKIENDRLEELRGLSQNAPDRKRLIHEQRGRRQRAIDMKRIAETRLNLPDSGL